MYYLIGYGKDNHYKVLVEASGANDAVWTLDSKRVGAYFRANILNKFSTLQGFDATCRKHKPLREWRNVLKSVGYIVVPDSFYSTK